MDFDYILEDCKKRYGGFDRELTPREPRGFGEAILGTRERGLNPIIAEVKYSSPGSVIRSLGAPAKIAEEMIRGGACGLSVLTEERFFGGSLENLRKVSEVSTVPVLRKDFLFEPSQVREAYHYGADSVLLIASFFEAGLLSRMVEECRLLGMEPLVEVHSKEDVERAEGAGAEIFVINNRDKDTLEVDLDRCRTLSRHVEGIKIGASGIESERDLKHVLRYCDCALIGTSIMLTEDVEGKVRGFVHA